MDRIGIYRMKLYDLLYTNPICDHIRGGRVSVLLLGSGWVGSEALKAVYWAGQYTDCRLHITVASQNADTYGAALYAALPALSQPDCADTACLRFCAVTDLTDEAALDRLVRETDCDYVIVSLGELSVGEAAAKALTRIRTASARSYAVHLFDDTAPSGPDACGFFRFGAALGETHEELKRMARNIDFAYKMKYDACVSKQAAYDAFHEEYGRLIGRQTDTDDPSAIVRLFTGREYNTDSSFSCAVHMPYKLHLCRTYAAAHGIQKDAFAVLADAIREKNALYRKLMTMEHQRWMAFMAMYGFCYPSEAEQTRLYHGKNDHRSKESGERLWHMCMCACGGNGLTLAGHPDLWDKAQLTAAEEAMLSPLDRASLSAHRAACAKANVQIKTYRTLTGNAKKLRTLIEQTQETAAQAVYTELEQSIKKLCADDDNAVMLYQNALAAAKQAAAEQGVQDLFDAIESDLRCVVIRSSRIDFFANDAQLVDMLPFCIWYDKAYRTVITVGGDASQDIIAPALLCAERAVFLVDAAQRESYAARVTAFFQNRGGNTVCDVRAADMTRIDTITEAIDAAITETGLKNAVFAVVPCQTAVKTAAVGMALQRHPALEAVSLHPETGLVSLRGNTLLCTGLSRGHISVAEHLLLQGALYENLYTVVDRSRYGCLYGLYPQYNRLQAKKLLWIELIRCIQTAMKGADIVKKEALTAQTSFVWETVFPADVFAKCRLKELFSDLSACHIISHYTQKTAHNSVSVRFHCYDNVLADYLASYCADGTETDRFVQFSAEGNIREYQLRGTVTAPKDLTADMQAFLEDLYALGFLTEPPKPCGTAFAIQFCEPYGVMLLQKSGTVFEYLVYHILRSTGLFDDVEIGIALRWYAGQDDLTKLTAAEMGDAYGLRAYRTARDRVRKQGDCRNEIDVAVTKGMTACFVSCKAGAELKNEWLYEISALAQRCGCRPCLVVSADLSLRKDSGFQSRAALLGVTLIGIDTLLDPEKLRLAADKMLGESK